MFSDLELMNIHVRALFTHNAKSRLLFVNEPGSDSGKIAPRLFLGRTRTGNIWRFRAGLPKKLYQELEALCAKEPPINTEFEETPRHLEALVRMFEVESPVQNISNGLAYQFTKYEMPSTQVANVNEENAEMLRGGFEKLIEELPSRQPFVALVNENRAVSVCRSVRITNEAHEAGVETLPEFRGNGYAKDIVSAWAQIVRQTGAIPLYSTSFENTASQAVAQKLGLKCYGFTFKIT